MDVQVNLIAVVAAMISSMVVGATWYSQGVFGKTWMKLAKIKIDKDGPSPLKPMLITMVVSLITAYVLAHVAYLSHDYFANSFLQDTLTTAFWMWLGFTAARFVTHDAFEGRPSQLTLINIGNEFVTLMVMGLVIGLIGL